MIYQIEENYVGKYAIVTFEEYKKYAEEYGYYLESAVSSYPNEFIEYVDHISTGQTFFIVEYINDTRFISNGSLNYIFKVHKEGEIINRSKGLKLIMSKDENGKWKITVEKLEEENPTTTKDTATIQ